MTGEYPLILDQVKVNKQTIIERERYMILLQMVIRP